MNEVKVSAIVAIDEKRGMGKDGGIPWKIPDDQKRFKEITTPHPMIMGRKTFASIGRILPNRPHLIITRDTNYQVNGAELFHSLSQAIKRAKKIEQQRVIANEAWQSREIFIIGGGEIFKAAMPFIDRL